MKIAAITPAALQPVPALVPDPHPEQPKAPAPGGTKAAATRAAISFSSPLSAETQFHTAVIAQDLQHPAQPHLPPAQEARAALAADPALADRPFGFIVSRMARGEPLPPAAVTDPVTPLPADDVPAAEELLLPPEVPAPALPEEDLPAPVVPPVIFDVPLPDLLPGDIQVPPVIVDVPVFDLLTGNTA